MSLHPYVNTAIAAARAAGDFIIRSSRDIDRIDVTTKRTNDYVTEVDRKAEQIIIETLLKSYPDHGIIGEEGGERKGRLPTEWIIDPLDGTTNYLHRLPQYCVSIACRKDGVIEHAVIYDPWSQELFTATRGQGALLDGRRIRVSGRRGLDGSLIGTGFPIAGGERLQAYMPMLEAVLENTAGARRAGSAALDLAYVAAGRLDAFWELKLKPWDIAAGALLVQEAGGIVSEAYGGDDVLKTGSIIAGSPKVHAELSSLLSPFLDRPPVD